MSRWAGRWRAATAVPIPALILTLLLALAGVIGARLLDTDRRAADHVASSQAHAGARILVTDEVGGVVVDAALPPDETFQLDYQHSYYDQPASESFQTQPGGFRLVAVTSSSRAVLDYYDLAGRTSQTTDGGHVLRPTSTAQLAELALIATPKGRRTLVVDGHRFPLYAATPARHLLLRVQR